MSPGISLFPLIIHVHPRKFSKTFDFTVIFTTINSLQYGTCNSKLSLGIFKLMIPNQTNPNLDTYLIYSRSLRSCLFYLLFNPKFSWKAWEKIVHQTPSYFPATLKLLLYCISYAPAASNSLVTYFSLFASSLV